MRHLYFLLIFTLTSMAHALTADQLYWNCKKEKGRLEECISDGIESDPELRKRFQERTKTMDAYLKKTPPPATKSCGVTHARLVKVGGGNLRFETCDARGKCHPYSTEVSLVVNEKQRNQMVGTNQTQMGIITRDNPDAIPRDCEVKQGMCHRLFKGILGFTPVTDSNFGALGTKVERVETREATNPGALPITKYHITRKVTATAPARVFAERLPLLFSGRNSNPSLASAAADRMQLQMERAGAKGYKNYFENTLFNIHLAQQMEQKVRRFATSSARAMKFTFFGIDEDLCADPIYQHNDTRRGMNLTEALYFEKRNRSGELVNVIEKTIVTNTSRVLITVANGFIKDQLSTVDPPPEAEKTAEEPEGEK